MSFRTNRKTRGKFKVPEDKTFEEANRRLLEEEGHPLYTIKKPRIWQNRNYWTEKGYNVETGKSDVGQEYERFSRIYDDNNSRFGYHIGKNRPDEAVLFALGGNLDLVVQSEISWEQIRSLLLERIHNEELAHKVYDDIQFDIRRLKLTKGWMNP